MRPRNEKTGDSLLRLNSVVSNIAGWLVVAAWLPLHADAELFAGRIEPDTPERVRARGSDAIAGIGDWALSNGYLCAAVLGADSEGQLVAGGGSLVDLAHCDRGDDQWLGLEPLYNLSRMEFLTVSDVVAEVTAQESRIVTVAREDGLVLTTAFVLDRADPQRIRIESRLVREGPGRRLFIWSELALNTNNTLRNFTRNRVGPHEGFEHINLERSPYLQIAAAIRTVSTSILVGSDEQGPPIAYGYRMTRLEREDRGGRRTPLDQFGLSMDSVSMINLFSEPLWFASDRLGLLQAAQVPWMDLEQGSAIVFEREVRVSPRSDVASLTDSSLKDAVFVSGTVSDPLARLHFDRFDGETTSPETMARPDRDGRFRLRLTAGSYRVRVLAPGGRSLERSFEVSGRGSNPSGREAEVEIELDRFDLPPRSRVALPQGYPMRLVFRGVGDTPDPRFGDDLTQARIGGELRENSRLSTDVHLTGTAGDPTEVSIAAGRYQVYATHGPEFSVTRAELHVVPGTTTALEIAPPLREVESPGWVSADFHVHAAPSFDSTLSLRHRIASFVAEGGEIIVATDHDVVSSYAAIIREMGLAHRLLSLNGIEVTSISHSASTPFSGGHVNVYPVPFRPELTRGGALRGEATRLRGIVAQARKLPTRAIVQLNHPRDTTGESHGGAFFEHLAVVGEPYDPMRPIDADPNRVLLERDPVSGLRDIDFDAIELLNGTSTDAYRIVRSDWFSLLRQGYLITGMANSDTHTLGKVAGVPRNYLKLSDERLEALGDERLADQLVVDAVRRGACFGTNGPIIDVLLGDKHPGDRFSGPAGTLRVAVRAASWVPISSLRVYVNGYIAREMPLTAPGTLAVDLRFDSDAFVTVEVIGEASGVYEAVLPGFDPIAFSNPIYVDADGDGAWTPPGL
ncbi:MAG: CehA/McbA family metallohydrolase [Myxococcota bacterium]